jgi:hypothetical protein
MMRAGLKEQQDADRRHHRVQARRVPQRVEHEPLRQGRQHRDDSGRADHREPVVEAERVHQVEGHERTRHVERAMREVGHVQDAVDQREAERDQAVDAAEREAVEHLLQKEIQDAAFVG